MFLTVFLIERNCVYRITTYCQKSNSGKSWSLNIKSPNHAEPLNLFWSWVWTVKNIVKGQLILQCPYEEFVSPKIPTKLFLDFCSEIIHSFLGASWKLLGLPWDLVSNITNKKAYRKPQKAFRNPPRSYKKLQGRNSEIISLVFWKKFSDHKDILKLTDL